VLIKYKEKDSYYFTFKRKDGKTYKTKIILTGEIIRRMKSNFSPIILVCGSQRSGKSFFALWFALKILNFFHPEKQFDVKRYNFYDPIESIKALDDLQKEPVIIDEAGSMFNKMEYYKRVSIAFDKIIQTQGYKTNLYIFISPFGLDIAKTFRRHFDYIIFVKKRGFAIIRKVPKRYDLLADKPLNTYFVETITIGKDVIPKEIWKQYEDFSFIQKEKIRIESYDSIMNNNKSLVPTDVFGRPI